MCNCYTLAERFDRLPIINRLDLTLGGRIPILSRKGGSGIVVLETEEGLKAELMNWGFERMARVPVKTTAKTKPGTPDHKMIQRNTNNTRTDNLASRMWSAALRERRCIVPMSIFYEWKHLPSGIKEPYAFHRKDDGVMWVAGIYERAEQHGPCYSTLTTEPATVAKPIHDRMLAVLDYEDALAYLHGGAPPDNDKPYEGPLVADPCESPLKGLDAKKPKLAAPKDDPPDQPNLI